MKKSRKKQTMVKRIVGGLNIPPVIFIAGKLINNVFLREGYGS